MAASGDDAMADATSLPMCLERARWGEAHGARLVATVRGGADFSLLAPRRAVRVEVVFAELRLDGALPEGALPANTVLASPG